MPEIKIRPAEEEDIPVLVAFEHSYKSNYCWQIEMINQEREIGVSFREIRLPRQVTTEYPRNPERLLKDWMNRTTLLVGDIGDVAVAYISLTEGISPTSAWVTDLVVSLPYRRKGIGTALLLAAQDWAKIRGNRRMVLEVQSKNMPAIHLALKLGYEFCGYQDLYFANQDTALFFAHFLR